MYIGILFVCTDSTSTSPNGKDLPCHDDIDRVRLQQPLTPYNRQDYIIPASAAGACDVMTYLDNCRQQMPFFDHLLPALLRRVAATAGPEDGGTRSLADGGSDVAGSGDVFACPDCTKRYSSASNLARHRITHQRPTTTMTVTTATTDRRVTRQCPHCAKVDQS